MTATLHDAFDRIPQGPLRLLSPTEPGRIELVDCMPRLITESELQHGLDGRIASVARVTTGHGDAKAGDSATTDLIRYLYRHHHSSPFEFAEFDFLVTAPIFVKIHLFRHRTASVNEQSRRYSPIQVAEPFYHPSADYVDGIRRQAKTNRQSSQVDQDFAQVHHQGIVKLETQVENVIQAAADLNNAGVANEVIRFALPMATYTTFRFKIDLRNLLHLLGLRTAADAQKETRDYANAMLELVEELYPVTFAVWREFAVESVTLSSREVEAIKSGGSLTGVSAGEIKEFAKKKERLGLT